MPRREDRWDEEESADLWVRWGCYVLAFGIALWAGWMLVRR